MHRAGVSNAGEHRTRYLYACPRGLIAIYESASGKVTNVVPVGVESQGLTSRDFRDAIALHKRHGRAP